MLLFTAPALLVLTWRAPGRSPVRRVFEALGPPMLLFLVAVLLHIAEGYNAAWFRHEFLEGKNAQSIWIPLGQGRGLFTVYHWKDLFNLALITAPVCLLVALTAWRRLLSYAREPRYLFLLVQIVSLAGMSVAVDRKLGGARDWDLLAAHSAGLILLAAMLLPGSDSGRGGGGGCLRARGAGSTRARERPRGSGQRSGARAPRALLDRPGPVVPLALGVSFLVGLPWIVLLHWEDRSISRFEDIVADFPAFPRGYAYEEVAKYYRKAGDLDRAQPLYDRQLLGQGQPVDRGGGHPQEPGHLRAGMPRPLHRHLAKEPPHPDHRAPPDARPQRRLRDARFGGNLLHQGAGKPALSAGAGVRLPHRLEEHLPRPGTLRPNCFGPPRFPGQPLCEYPPQMECFFS